jgi:hypothetical protein
MSALGIESMNDASQWSALQGDAVTPSIDFSISNELQVFRFGPDRVSGRVQATTAASSHLLRRSLGPFDLSGYDELRLALHSDRTADGTSGAPFFLELRLGSAALGVDGPANSWQRYLPVGRQNVWENHSFALVDLDPAVRSALTVLQLRCVDSSRAFRVYIDDVTATRGEMIADVDTALLARLHEAFELGGTPVPADVVLAGSSVVPMVPAIRLLHYATHFSNERTNQSESRADFNDGGYRLRGPSVAYDLFYAVEALATTRADQARILDFVLRTLGPRGILSVAGDELPLELVTPSELDRLRVSGLPGDRPLIYFRVLARQQSSSTRQVSSVQQVLVETGFKAA